VKNAAAWFIESDEKKTDQNVTETNAV